MLWFLNYWWIVEHRELQNSEPLSASQKWLAIAVLCVWTDEKEHRKKDVAVFRIVSSCCTSWFKVIHQTWRVGNGYTPLDLVIFLYIKWPWPSRLGWKSLGFPCTWEGSSECWLECWLELWKRKEELACIKSPQWSKNVFLWACLHLYFTFSWRFVNLTVLLYIL